jgi:S-DNA-T family DNA segregation ATPase FtsK/SpoIIIE
MADFQTFYKETAQALASYLQQELSLRAGLHYRIARVTNGPRVLALSIEVNPRYARPIEKLAPELSMAARLSKDAAIRVQRSHGGLLAVEVPKPKGLWYTVTTAHLPRHRGVKTTVGLDTDKRPAIIDLSANLTPHWLIAGSTGSGKTNAQRLLVSRLAIQARPEQVKLLLIDTEKHGKAWRPFASLPHLAHPVITEHDEAARALGWAVAEMDQRAREDRSAPRLIIGIDEVQGLFEARPDLVKLVDRIAAVGREWGVHLVIATQNPTAEHLGSASIKRNMARLVGRVTDATAALVASGQRDSGAEHLTNSGDMLRIDADGTARVAVALVEERDMDALPRVETVPALDLSQFEDSSRVDGGRAEAILPEQVAVALAENLSINKLQKRLKVGGSRATRIKEFAEELRMALQAQGHSILPAKQAYEPENFGA